MLNLELDFDFMIRPPINAKADARQRRPTAWRALVSLGLVLGALCLTSCQRTNCVQEGCEGQLICDVESGQCVTQTLNCEETGCPGDQICGDDGRCLERGTFCLPPGEGSCPEGDCAVCPEGLVCEARTGLCIASGECRYINCPLAQRCAPNTRTCLDIICFDDTECPAGSVCADNNVCRAGCRQDNQCRDGEVCLLNSSEDVGNCQTTCTADDECDWGQICVLQGSGRSSCQAEPPCEVDGECRLGETCRQNTCRRALCFVDGECAVDEYCRTDTGECLPDTCRADRYEDNDTLEQARSLLRGSYDGLTLCRGEEDWFKIEVEDIEGLRVSILHGLDVDLDLEATTASGRLLGRAGFGRNSETLLIPTTALTQEARREVFVRVRATKGQDIIYFLNIGTTTLRCNEDMYEPNNHSGEATAGNAGERLTFVTCPGNDDHIRIQHAGGPLSLSGERQANPGDEEEASGLLSWRGRLGISDAPFDSLTFDEDAQWRVAWAHVDGDVTLSATSSDITSWVLDISEDGPSCQDDSPDNGRPDGATLLEVGLDAPQTTGPHALCAIPDEDDLERRRFEENWFAVNPPDEAVNLRVSLEPLDEVAAWARAPLRATLMVGPADDPQPWRAVTAGDGEGQTMNTRVSRVDRPLWLRIDAPEGLPAALAQWPQYELQINADAASGCVQDLSEAGGNDRPERATPLSRDALSVILCPDDVDVLALDLQRFNGQPPVLRLQTLDVPITLVVQAALDGPALFEATLTPQEGQVTVQGAFSLPEDAAQLWLTLAAQDEAPETGARVQLEVAAPEDNP